MSNGLLLSSDCDYYATADDELVIFDTRDNRTLMLDGALALLLQIMQSGAAGCAVSKTELRNLLHKENVRFDDLSLNMWIGKLIDLHLISNTQI
jgi:hypothetical protein